MDNKNDKTNKPTLHSEPTKAPPSESGMTKDQLQKAQKPDALPKQPQTESKADKPTENATAGDAHGNPVNEPGMSHGARPA